MVSQGSAATSSRYGGHTMLIL